jgi:hypothetical protein
MAHPQAKKYHEYGRFRRPAPPVLVGRTGGWNNLFPEMNTKEIIMNRNFAKTLTVAIGALAMGMASTAYAQDKGCSNSSLHGTFGYTSTGTIVAPPEIAGPVAEVGSQNFDGAGGTTATATISSNGSSQALTILGTYQVNPDCTGTAELQVSPFDITVHVLFVIVDGGDGFQAMETDSGFVITRFGRKLYPGKII